MGAAGHVTEGGVPWYGRVGIWWGPRGLPAAHRKDVDPHKHVVRGNVSDGGDEVEEAGTPCMAHEEVEQAHVVWVQQLDVPAAPSYVSRHFC